MPKGYWIAHVDVTDPEIYKKYLAANGVAFAKYGARFLVRAGQPASSAGSCPSHGESSRSSAPASLTPSDSWIVRTTMRPMRPAAPLTISLMSAISASPIGGQLGCGPS